MSDFILDVILVGTLQVDMVKLGHDIQRLVEQYPVKLSDVLVDMGCHDV